MIFPPFFLLQIWWSDYLLPHHSPPFRATFTRSWRAYTSVTVVVSFTGTSSPKTSSSTTRVLLSWQTLAWHGLLVFPSGSTPTRWEKTMNTSHGVIVLNIPQFEKVMLSKLLIYSVIQPPLGHVLCKLHLSPSYYLFYHTILNVTILHDTNILHVVYKQNRLCSVD